MESAPFPENYPSGNFGFDFSRPPFMYLPSTLFSHPSFALRKLRESEFTKHQLRRRDPRFAENKEYIFAETSRKRLRAVSSTIFCLTNTRTWSRADANSAMPTVSDVLRYTAELYSIHHQWLKGSESGKCGYAGLSHQLPPPRPPWVAK